MLHHWWLMGEDATWPNTSKQSLVINSPMRNSIEKYLDWISQQNLYNFPHVFKVPGDGIIHFVFWNDTKSIVNLESNWIVIIGCLILASHSFGCFCLERKLLIYSNSIISFTWLSIICLGHISSSSTDEHWWSI